MATTTTIQVSPGLLARIRQRVDSGDFASTDAVLEEALALLEAHDRLGRLRAAIAVGDAQLGRDEGIEWTPDSMARLKREAAENVRTGKPIKGVIIPSCCAFRRLGQRRQDVPLVGSPVRRMSRG